MTAEDSLPWRGPGSPRPELPLPPEQLPIRRRGVWRKRWRYAAFFGERMLGCAARVQVGPVGQTFWALWDREERRMWERTRMRLPGGRGEVWSEAPDREGLRNHAPDRGALVRIEAAEPEVGRVRAFLRYGPGGWVESVCPAAGGNYVWTRKRVGAAVEADVRIGEQRIRFDALGVEDESEGYHPHHTVWSWSAGVGRSTNGQTVGWNLVSGVNDPPERSERAIWVDGVPVEPGPVSFDGLEAVAFEGGERLELTAEAERRREESKPFVKYSYRQPFGSFRGTLAGGIELADGLGVIEHHDAHW